jgi:hypothetical protein
VKPISTAATAMTRAGLVIQRGAGSISEPSGPRGSARCRHFQGSCLRRSRSLVQLVKNNGSIGNFSRLRREFRKRGLISRLEASSREFAKLPESAVEAE